MPIRILLADNRSRVRFALRALLKQSPELSVVSEAGDAEGLLDEAKAGCPDLVLLDWELRGPAEANLVPALQEICPGVCVVVLSGRPELRRAALAAGADAFVSKTDPPDKLLLAIEACRAQRHAEPLKDHA